MNDVTQYALDVLNGKIVAGQSVVKACQRHMNDLDKQGTEGFPFLFSEGKADNIINFAQKLKIAEGFEVKPLRLASFQKFILGSLFGWVHKDTGYRRFRQSYTQLSRQQGKSLLNGVLGIYCSNFDGYRHPQINIAAPKLKQSKIVFNEMIKMIEIDDDLAEMFNIKDYKSEIQALNTSGVITALSRDNKLDGFRSYLAILDEYHEHPTNDIYNGLLYGQRNLAQCLTSIITTAGKDFNSPCYPMYNYCLDILDNPSDNERLFVYIAQMDKDDDIWDSKNWIKCMPLINNDMIETVEIDAHKARSLGGKELNDFMTKVFNIWCTNTDTQYIDIERWNDLSSKMSLEDMKEKEAYVGIDLSGGGTGDLISLAFEFPLDDGKIFIHSMSFMAKEHLNTKMQIDNAPYDRWSKDGLLELTDGYKTDYKRVLEYLEELQQHYGIKYKMICYDPHGINMILDDLTRFGCPVTEVVQSARSLNEATLDFRLSVQEGSIIYNENNALLTWSINNAQLDYNSFGECKIAKFDGKRNRRIDPVDAIINAHKWAMLEHDTVDLNEYITEESMRELGWY